MAKTASRIPMKNLPLLLCLLFLGGCEKRVADPEFEAVRKWLLSGEGQKQLGDQLALEGSGVALEQLEPSKNWVVRRSVGIFDDSQFGGGKFYLLFGKEKAEGKWWTVRCFSEKSSDQFVLATGFYALSRREFEETENLGDPISMEEMFDILLKEEDTSR